MRSLRVSAVIVSMGLVLIGSAAARGETYSISVGGIPWGSGDAPFYIQIGDFNGDGHDDIFSPWPKYFNPAAGENRAHYFYGSFSPGVVPPNALVEARREPKGAANYTFAGDFNGDGTEEIVTFIGGLAMFMPQAIQNSVVYSSVDNHWGAGNYTFAGDFDGDGIDDIASANGSTVFMKLGSPGTICTTPPAGSHCERFTSTAWYGASNQWGGGDYTFAGDFNGDGRADIASMYGSTAYMKLSTGSGFTSVAWPINGTWGGHGYTRAGDFNGDGLHDIATAIGNRVYLKYSTGTGFRYGGSQVVGGSWGGAPYTWVVRNSSAGRDEIATAVGDTIYFHRFEDTGGGGGGGGGGPGNPGDRCKPLCL